MQNLDSLIVGAPGSLVGTFSPTPERATCDSVPPAVIAQGMSIKADRGSLAESGVLERLSCPKPTSVHKTVATGP